MESLAESTIETWMAGKEEVQLVDMVLRIRAKLTEATAQHLPLPDIVKERLEKHVATIVKTLPSDLQVVLQRGTILNLDRNYNASCNSDSGRNSNERTIDILENSSEHSTNGNDELKDSPVTSKHEDNTSQLRSPIPEQTDNQTAQTLVEKTPT